MTIIAKYPGTCPTCRKPIASGQQVEWNKGSKARHVACGTGEASVAQPQPRIATARKAWGAARGMGPGHGAAAPVRGYSSYCTDRPNCRCYDCAS